LFAVAGESGGHHSSNGIPLGALVLKPLTKFNKLIGKDGALTVHSNNKYHLTCAQKARDFLSRTAAGSANDVRNKLVVGRREAIEENRQNLRPIVDTKSIPARA